jgi:hypothetical protein
MVFSGNIQHLLKVGTKTPSNSGYYVQDDDGKNYVISQAGIDALLKLLTAPPYAATQTPISTATETQSPTADLGTTSTP